MDGLDWLDPSEYEAVRAFVRSAKRLFAALDRELEADAGVGRTYFEILFLLFNSPGRAMRMSELAEVTGSHPSRITHAISRLEAAGHVRRELCEEDRRGWFAVLTDAGEALLRRAAPVHARGIREHLLDVLSATERAQLTRIGETVLAHFEESDGGRADGRPAERHGALSGAGAVRE